MLERLLVTTRVLTRAGDRAGAYRMRQIPTLPPLGPVGGPRVRTRAGSAGSAGCAEVPEPAVATTAVVTPAPALPLAAAEACQGKWVLVNPSNAAVNEPIRERECEQAAVAKAARVETSQGIAPGPGRWRGRWFGGRGWTWPWAKARGSQGAVRQMELPLQRGEALTELKVVRNDLRDADEELWGQVGRAAVANGWGPRAWLAGLRAVQRWFDAWVARLAGSRRG